MRSSVLASLLVFLPPATAITTSSGCLTCTLIGYENGVQIRIDVPPAPAHYRIEVDAGGESLAVEYEVQADTGADPRVYAACIGECAATGTNLRFSESFTLGSGDPEDPIVLLGNYRSDDSQPDRVAVRVFRDGVQVADDVLRPRYETDEPNGRGCGEHVYANATIGVP